MKDILEKHVVLVLNRNWQAINVRTPAEAFCQMAGDAATGMDIDGELMIPVRWNDWLTLPVRHGDWSVGTPRGPVRVPTVIILSSYAKVPMRKPRFSSQGVYERDAGVCQYTGRRLQKHEANIDHVVPRSKGGGTTWNNCVLADKKINTIKADKTPEEAGLPLLRAPREPKAVPVTSLIKNTLGVADWRKFLVS